MTAVESGSIDEIASNHAADEMRQSGDRDKIGEYAEQLRVRLYHRRCPTDPRPQLDHDLLQSRGISALCSLDLAYNHLSVRGTGGADDVTYGHTLGGIIAPWTGRKYKKKAATLATARMEGEENRSRGEGSAGTSWSEGDKRPGKALSKLKQGERYLIEDCSGLVKAGEMMLVVGRPGAGCTTFLKTLAGLDSGYAGKDGEVWYGAMESAEDLKPFRSAVIFHGEEGESARRPSSLLIGQIYMIPTF